MRTFGPQPLDLLPPTGDRVGGEPAADAADRRAVHEDPVLRQPEDDGGHEQRRARRSIASGSSDSWRSMGLGGAASRTADHDRGAGCAGLHFLADASGFGSRWSCRVCGESPSPGTLIVTGGRGDQRRAVSLGGGPDHAGAPDSGAPFPCDSRARPEGRQTPPETIGRTAAAVPAIRCLGVGSQRRGAAAARAASDTSRRQASCAAGVQPRIGRAGLPVSGWPAWKARAWPSHPSPFQPVLG